MPESVALTAIIMDPSLQPRVNGVDPDHVCALQETPDAWPPILVVRHGEGYLLLDGFNRYAAAQNLCLTTITATVIQMPADGDLARIAFEANLAHGLPLTLGDKRAYAERLLTYQPEISNLEVARRTVLSPTTVAAVRQRLEEAATIPPVEQRVGKQGQAYTLPNSYQRPLGELPPIGVGTQLRDAIGAAFTPKERVQQRRIAGYLQRLAIALEDQYDVEGWDNAQDAADACRLVLGDQRAAELAAQLGSASGHIYAVALALGYREDAEP